MVPCPHSSEAPLVGFLGADGAVAYLICMCQPHVKKDFPLSLHEKYCVQCAGEGRIINPLVVFARQRSVNGRVERAGASFAIKQVPWVERGGTILVPFEQRGELVPVLEAIFEKVVEEGKGSGGKGIHRVKADVSWHLLLMLLVESGGRLPPQFDPHLDFILGKLAEKTDVHIGPFKVKCPHVAVLRRMAVDGALTNAKCAARLEAIQAQVAEQLQVRLLLSALPSAPLPPLPQSPSPECFAPQEVREEMAKMTAMCMQEMKQLAEKQDSINTSQGNFNAETLRKVEKLFKMYTDAEHAHAAYGAAYSEAFAQQEGDIRAVAKEVINLSTRVSGLSAEMGQVAYTAHSGLRVPEAGVPNPLCTSYRSSSGSRRTTARSPSCTRSSRRSARWSRRTGRRRWTPTSTSVPRGCWPR